MCDLIFRPNFELCYRSHNLKSLEKARSIKMGNACIQSMCLHPSRSVNTPAFGQKLH